MTLDKFIFWVWEWTFLQSSISLLQPLFGSTPTTQAAGFGGTSTGFGGFGGFGSTSTAVSICTCKCSNVLVDMKLIYSYIL